MQVEKYIKVCIEFGMPILDVIGELQELADNYPDLKIWQSTELEFKTPNEKDEE